MSQCGMAACVSATGELKVRLAGCCAYVLEVREAATSASPGAQCAADRVADAAIVLELTPDADAELLLAGSITGTSVGGE